MLLLIRIIIIVFIIVVVVVVVAYVASVARVSSGFKFHFFTNTPYSKSLERAWNRGIVDRTKYYSFVLSTMPQLHAGSRLLELGILLKCLLWFLFS